jgi:SAM-dependent methyltransferase
MADARRATERAEAAQYATDANLRARMALHARFATNPVPWMRWVFDQLALREGESVLEVGCGTGALWVGNADRTPAGCTLRLTDASAAMVDAARDALSRAHVEAQVEVMSAESLAVGTASQEVVVANHMLYHVADLRRALAEIRRVLRPSGRLVASTNGRRHMIELDDLAEEVVRAERDRLVERFGLENGADVLGATFDDVTLRGREDALEVTDADALVAYVASLPTAAGLSRSDLERLRARIAAHLARGPFHITRQSGVFLARPRGEGTAVPPRPPDSATGERS